jgi:hypothetical protein
MIKIIRLGRQLHASRVVLLQPPFQQQGLKLPSVKVEVAAKRPGIGKAANVWAAKRAWGNEVPQLKTNVN